MRKFVKTKESFSASLPRFRTEPSSTAQTPKHIVKMLVQEKTRRMKQDEQDRAMVAEQDRAMAAEQERASNRLSDELRERDMAMDADRIENLSKHYKEQPKIYPNACIGHEVLRDEISRDLAGLPGMVLGFRRPGMRSARSFRPDPATTETDRVVTDPVVTDDFEPGPGTLGSSSGSWTTEPDDRTDDNWPLADAEEFEAQDLNPAQRNPIAQSKENPEELGQLAGDAPLRAPKPLGMSVSSPNLTSTITSSNTITEEADGDILPPQAEPHRKGVFSRKRETTVQPPKAPKKKSSFDMFSWNKKPTAEPTAKLTISAPIIPDPHEEVKGNNTGRTTNTSERVETPRAHLGDTEGVSSPTTTSADAMRIQEQIMRFQRLVDEQNARLHPVRTETMNSKNGDGSSSLSKSKSMFLNAKQALVGRFSSSAEKEAMARAKNNSSLPNLSSFDPDHQSRINRRVAEGINLGSPKVQQLTGDGRIKRKPLPTYKSMETLSSTFEDDPFTDKTGMEEYGRSTYSHSSPEIDLSPRKNKQRSSPVDSAPPPPMPTFSNTISGLRQHPNVMTFTSRPLAVSTPRARVEPQTNTEAEKKQTGASDHHPPTTDFPSVTHDDGPSDQSDHLAEYEQQTTTTAEATATTPSGTLDADDTGALASKTTNGKLTRTSRLTTGKAAVNAGAGVLSRPTRNRLAKRSGIPKPVVGATDSPRSERKASVSSPYRVLSDEEEEV